MEPNRSQIRGKDLAGAIKVMPMGLDAAIKKRVSGEFKSEQRGGMVSFSEADQSQPGPMKMESRQMATCQEEVSEVRTSTKGLPSPFQQAGFKSAPLAEPVETAQHQAHSQQMSSTSSSTQKSMMSSSSSSSSKSVTMQSSSKVQKEFGETRSTVSFQPTQLEPAPQLQHQEIGQDSLKTQLVSCISDLEKDREFVDFNKENKPLSLASPPQAFSPGPSFSPAPKQDTFSPGPKADMFSPPPLEPIQPLAAASALPALPARNEVRNGLSDFLGAGAKTAETSSLSQYESSSFQQTSVQESSFQQTSTQQSFVQEHGTNGFEESGSLQASGSSTSLLQKIMTPAPTEYDSGSLKRRDPRKMFTDSSFYSAKHHPTVADQVEMAHKLSSAMFNDKNKSTKGQQMFLSRVQNAGEEDLVDGEPKAPSLKHVMNSGGRMVEWGDLDQEDLPNVEAMANHLVPNLNTPDPIAESLNAEAGKGESSLPRPSTFVSAYRRVFEQNRVVFGAGDVPAAESPRSARKGAATPSGTKGPIGSPLVGNKNNDNVAASNLNKNRMVAQKSVTIVDSKARDSKAKDSTDSISKDMVEMKPVTVRIKEEPTAPPRKAHFQPAGGRQAAPLHSTVPHFIDNQKPLDNAKFASPKLQESQLAQVLDNRVPLKRHASFNEKTGLDNRNAKVSVWENTNLNLPCRPADVLRTPYLLSSSSRALHHGSSQAVGNFPHIPGNSMVAKTKALFEGPAEGNYNRQCPAPLTKSRTFSSFPTGQDLSSGPPTPSVPQRCSSRKIIHTYKSMNGDINDCGVDSASCSPMVQRRIPMAKFF